MIATGDGKTCPTSWEVVSLDEEYFVLRMLGARPGTQTVVTEGKSCDKLEATNEDGQPQTFFFDIGLVLARERQDLEH